MRSSLRQPRVVGLGGTVRDSSATEKALEIALEGAREAGACTRIFAGTALSSLPQYDPSTQDRTAQQRELVELVREADGLMIATPSYHAGISALVKNAIDLLEDLREDARPYLDGRAIGCIVTAFGWQGAGTTLVSLRSIVHALRGWPTPLGVTLNTSEPIFDTRGALSDPKTVRQLKLMGRQVTEFAQWRIAAGLELDSGPDAQADETGSG